MSNNVFSKASERLRLLADEMGRLGSEPVPAEAYGDIASAARRLRQLGLGTSCIHLQFWPSGMGKESAIEWSIWDGSEHYKGKTLDQAMKTCIIAHARCVAEDAEALAINAIKPPAERIADLAEKLTNGEPIEADFSGLTLGRPAVPPPRDAETERLVAAVFPPAEPSRDSPF